MFAENVFDITKSDGTHITELKEGNNLLWERAVQCVTDKQPVVSFRNTRRTNGDGVNYPVFQAGQVLPHLKAHGATPVKHKAPKLWGQYVPCDGITNGASTSIDTGIKAQDNIEVYVRVLAKTDSFYILQARETGSAKIYGISGSQTGNTITSFGLTSGIARTVGHIYTLKLTIINRAVTLYVKDETTGTEDTKTGTVTASAYPFPSPTTIKLFGDASRITSGVTVYRAYIKVNGQAVWDMYPCVDVTDNNRVVAYDDVAHDASTVVSGSITGGNLIQPISYITNPRFCTSIKPNQDTKIKMRFRAETITTSLTLIGARNASSGSERKGFVIWQNVGSHMRFDYQSGSVAPTDGYNANAWNTVEKDGIHNYLNGVSQNDNNAATFQCDYELYIGTLNTGGTVGSGCEADVAEVYIDDALYMPVKVGASVYYLNTATWVLLSGTGTAGADIPYTQLVPDIIRIAAGDIQYGQYGKNLFDGVSNIVLGKYINSSDGTIGSSATNFYCETYFECKPSTSYVFWGERKTDGVLSKYNRVHFYDNNKEFISSASYVVGAKTVVVSPSNARFVRISCNVLDSGTLDTNTINRFNWYIGEGTASTEYEPYKYGIFTDGSHKVFVGSQGVVDLGTLVWTRLTTGNLCFMASVSGMITGKRENAIACTAYLTADNIGGGNLDEGEICQNTSGGITNNVVCVLDSRYSTAADFKAAMSGKYLFYQRTDDTEFIPPIIRTIPTLYSEDSFCDTQLASNNVSEAWAVKVLDGTENIRKSGTYAGSFFVRNVVSDWGTSNNAQVYCSHFSGVTKDTDYAQNKCMILNNAFNMWWASDNTPTVEQFTQWLASEKAKGTPVIILYPLATPAISTAAVESVALTTKATHTVTAEASLAVKSQATYLGKGE